jgi:hypothetical protein
LKRIFRQLVIQVTQTNSYFPVISFGSFGEPTATSNRTLIARFDINNNVVKLRSRSERVGTPGQWWLISLLRMDYFRGTKILFRNSDIKLSPVLNVTHIRSSGGVSIRRRRYAVPSAARPCLLIYMPLRYPQPISNLTDILTFLFISLLYRVLTGTVKRDTFPYKIQHYK